MNGSPLPRRSGARWSRRTLSAIATSRRRRMSRQGRGRPSASASSRGRARPKWVALTPSSS
eukprot:974442-Alexandrium_andersonii.AAC.1